MADKVNKLEIREYPDPILKKAADKVLRFNDGLWDFIRALTKKMLEADGAGLAAPQVGMSKRIFVVNIGGEPMVFVNPKIFDKSGKQVEAEGCLSLPGLEAKVRRAKSLRCCFLDEKGEAQEIKADGLLARVIQHENDHLDGVLFVDRLMPWARKGLLKKYKG